MNWNPRWRGIELRHLVALQAVESERSFSAAAARLGYTQSAVSGQILALERVIGARLFERSRGARPLGLTRAGAVLLAHAAAITAHLDAAQADLTAAREGESQSVRIGTFPAVAPSLVPSALRSFDAEVELHARYDALALLDELELGELDVAFAVLPVAERFASVELYRDEYVLVVRAEERAVARGGRPVLWLDDGTAEPPFEVARRLHDVASLLGFVSVGSGVGAAPSRALELPSGLVALPLCPAPPPLAIGLAWLRNRTLPPAVESFVELARGAAAQLGSRALLRAI